MEVTRENLTKKSFLHEAQLESKLFSYSSSTVNKKEVPDFKATYDMGLQKMIAI